MSAKGVCVCKAVRYCVAGICLVVAIYCLAFLVYMTPLYSPIVCVEGEKRFGDAVVNAALDIPGELELKCTNLNKYSVGIRMTEVGRVTAWPDNVEIGQCRLDHHTMPAGGSDLSLVHLNLSIPMDFVVKLYDKGYSEIFVDVGVKVEITSGLLPPFSNVFFTTEVDKTVVCAMTIGSTLPVKTSALVCRDSREEFSGRIPPLDSDGEKYPFGFKAPEAFFSRYQKILHTTLGTVTAVTLTLALMLLRSELGRPLRCLVRHAFVAELSLSSKTSDVDVTVAEKDVEKDVECGADFKINPWRKSDEASAPMACLGA